MSDREKLIELMCDGTLKTEICTTDTHLECETCKGDCGYCTILADHLISNGVTVQKHGRWEESWSLEDCFWVCSSCHFPSEALAAPYIYNYCPNCGAKMNKECE